MKKQFCQIILLAAVLISCTSCAKNTGNHEEIISTPSPQPKVAATITSEMKAELEVKKDSKAATDSDKEVKEALQPSTASAYEGIFNGKDKEYQTMVERSLITTGNNYRLKKAIEKAKKGEEITIAYIGGSITEGAGASSSTGCYAYQSYLYFKENYGKGDGSNVRFVNTGMGGTPSTLGIIRYDRDVTEYGKVQPDIVFIEFAVNDYLEPTNGAAYESLVRKVLSSEKQPAVILMFSVFKSKWNMQELYIPVGNHYNLPMISVRNAVVPELESGEITEEQYFSDDFHPTDFGHGVMADCVKYYFSTVNEESLAANDITIPDKAIIGKDYEGIKLIDAKQIDEKVSVTPGGFTGTDDQLCRFATGELTFPDNWKHESTSGAKHFVLKLTCKNLLFVYKSCSAESFGDAEVYVDDKLVKTIISSEGGGWTNPIPVLLINEDSAATHTVEIKMAAGSEEKEFTILAFGYTQ